MSEKTGFKYSIKFNQSTTSGTLGFEGYYAFDDKEDYDPEAFVELLQKTEEAFLNEGYKIARITPTSLERMKLKQIEEENKEKAKIAAEREAVKKADQEEVKEKDESAK